MQDKYLKARVPSALYQALLERAGIEGKRLGTHIREVLERDAQAVTTTEALTRIEAALAASAPVARPSIADHDIQRALTEMRLLLRELAMQSNAQIVTRVAAQLAAQAPQTNVREVQK